MLKFQPSRVDLILLYINIIKFIYYIYNITKNTNGNDSISNFNFNPNQSSSIEERENNWNNFVDEDQRVYT